MNLFIGNMVRVQMFSSLSIASHLKKGGLPSSAVKILDSQAYGYDKGGHRFHL